MFDKICIIIIVSFHNKIASITIFKRFFYLYVNKFSLNGQTRCSLSSLPYVYMAECITKQHICTRCPMIFYFKSAVHRCFKFLSVFTVVSAADDNTNIHLIFGESSCVSY